LAGKGIGGKQIGHGRTLLRSTPPESPAQAASIVTFGSGSNRELRKKTSASAYAGSTSAMAFDHRRGGGQT
jgi:hypothetical protein